LAFLDEPTAGIDPILRAKFWKRFRAMAGAGKSLVVTTQYVGEAGECDLVGLLSDGELLLLDTPDNLRRAAFSGEVVDVTLNREPTDAEVGAIAAMDFVVGDSIERLHDRQVRIVVDSAERSMLDIGAALSSVGLEARDVREHKVDYDEAFVRVVERHRQQRLPTPAAEATREPQAEDRLRTVHAPWGVSSVRSRSFAKRSSRSSGSRADRAARARSVRAAVAVRRRVRPERGRQEGAVRRSAELDLRAVARLVQGRSSPSSSTPRG
jgi:ABC-type sulfate/molybdate transport systems ATPase subunit